MAQVVVPLNSIFYPSYLFNLLHSHRKYPRPSVVVRAESWVPGGVADDAYRCVGIVAEAGWVFPGGRDLTCARGTPILFPVRHGFIQYSPPMAITSLKPDHQNRASAEPRPTPQEIAYDVGPFAMGVLAFSRYTFRRPRPMRRRI